MFPHAFHQTKNECTECHATAEGGPLKNLDGKTIAPAGTLKPGKKDKLVHDEFCFKCHKAKKVKKGTSCNTCHKKVRFGQFEIFKPTHLSGFFLCSEFKKRLFALVSNR